MPRKLTPVERAGRQIAREERKAIDAYIHREHPVYTPEDQVNDVAIFTAAKERIIETQLEAAGKRRVYFEVYDCEVQQWATVFADERRSGPHGITASYALEQWRESGESLASFLIGQTSDYSGVSAMKRACLIRLYVIGGQTRLERERQYLASAAAMGFWKPGKTPIGEMKAEQVHRKAAGLQKLEVQGVLGQFSPTEINRFLRGHGVTPEHPNRAPRPAVRFPK